uniref:PDZ domain-containing protein n=1 Tax=Noctiluca scintillans TaxID=2966 RepID=A0A7S1F1M7_NOCSC
MAQAQFGGFVPLVFPPMGMDPFTFQWVTWRRETDRKLGISINFDEQNNLIQVASISESSLAGEKNRSIQAMPEVCSQDLRPGDIIEVVNQRTDLEEIQRELRSALNIHMKVVRKSGLSVATAESNRPAVQTAAKEPNPVSVPRQFNVAREAPPRARGPDWKVFQVFEGYDGLEPQGGYLSLSCSEFVEVRIGSEAPADDGNQFEGSNYVYGNRIQDRDQEGWFPECILQSVGE